MKVFHKAYDSFGRLQSSLQLKDIADNDAYGIALTVYPSEYVEKMLDGRGYITIRNAKPDGFTETTYQQDSL